MPARFLTVLPPMSPIAMLLPRPATLARSFDAAVASRATVLKLKKRLLD